MKKRLFTFIFSATIVAFSLATNLLKTDVEIPPYGINLLTNPSCDNNNFDGWTRSPTQSLWNAADEMWQSSYKLGEMVQTVDLFAAGFTEAQLSKSLYLLAAGSFICPNSNGARIGAAKIDVYAFDKDHILLKTIKVVELNYDKVDIPWDTYSVETDIPANVSSLEFHFFGKDCKFWQGYYGPQFDNMWLSLSTSESKSHKVTYQSDDNGSFIVDKSTANSGDTVTVIPTPAANYSLKSWTVETSIGSVINPVSDSTFVMPTGFDVTISGVFGKDGTETSVDILHNATSIKLYSEARSIIVENNLLGQKVQVYNINGNRIANTTNRIIAVPCAGLYLVRFGDKTQKIMVK